MKTSNYAIPFSDIREQTFASRIEIGFQERDSWRDAEAVFDEHTLVIEGHPVMEDWEDSYMRELAHIASTQKGSVLEVGFGMGISARYIQEQNPALHLVVEANKGVYEKLLDFATTANSKVQPLFGFWQDVTHKTIEDGSLSGILFDTYPLQEDEIHRNHFPFFKEAYRMLKSGGVLTYYSDEINDYSDEHRKMLNEAGFTNIQKTVLEVSPPENCAYWKSRTIVAPIIIK
jgi:guanidinoacetate N-methyltransferase